MTIPILSSPLKVLCNYCERQKPMHEILRGNEKQGYLCYKCYHQHMANLKQLAEARPRECNMCQVTFAQLSERGLVEEMRLVVKDGLLLLCCLKCAPKYESKTERYKQTAYGSIMGYK